MIQWHILCSLITYIPDDVDMAVIIVPTEKVEAVVKRI
jgi:hypothetical protein